MTSIPSIAIIALYLALCETATLPTAGAGGGAIGKLIRESVPDKNGNTLPADLTTGSYKIRDLSDNRIGALFEGKVIYDKTYGHVTYGCAACCGYGIPYLWYDPISVLIEAEQGDGMYADYPCESEVDDVSSTFYNTWISDSTPIVHPAS